MKGVQPGFGMFCSARKGLVFDDSGRGQAFLSFFRTSEDETIHAAIVAKTETFEKIKGREREWLKGILPSFFPEVTIPKKLRHLTFAVNVAMGE